MVIPYRTTKFKSANMTYTYLGQDMYYMIYYITYPNTEYVDLEMQNTQRVLSQYYALSADFSLMWERGRAKTFDVVSYTQATSS